MAVRLKLNLFHFLFRLCSFLADKTGGWKLFVKPKLFLGSLLLGWTIAACNSHNNLIPNQPAKEIINNEPVIFCYHVEVMPTFPGGEKKMMEFLQENLIYPKEALEKGIAGRVICRFVIQEDGSVDDVEVIRSLSEETDREVLRIIKSMPKWTPAMQSGKAVPMHYTLPVVFKNQTSNGKGKK